MRIVGYRRADFVTKDGKEIKGCNVYIAKEINPDQGAGVSVESFYLTDDKCLREGIDLAALLGRNVRVYYNQYGKIDSIIADD